MEPLNGAQPMGPNKIPARKRKPTPEFLTALNLLADSYVVVTNPKSVNERSKSKNAQPKAELNH